MSRFRLVLKSFLHYFKANLLVALGVAISTTVLTGALVIGDSVKYSLEQSTFYRLGNTAYLVSSVDRYFRTELATELAKKSRAEVAPALILEGMAVSNGGQERVNKMQVIGVDQSFGKIAGTSLYSGLKDNEVIISTNLAERLGIKKGDEFLVRIKKASLIPMNAPFVSDVETSIALRAVVKEIAERNTMGFFNLKNSQTAPYNLFLSLAKLNELMKFSGKANNLLISGSTIKAPQIEKSLTECLTPEDAGLIVKDIPLTKEKEIISERVFIDNTIVKAFQTFKKSYKVLTYFVNGIQYKDKSTPYSFVTALEDEGLKENEIIINSWLAADLGAKQGDSLCLKYYEVGPLRQLVVKGSYFIVKKVVPMEGKYADVNLMPDLPGLSDVKNCRDWETGVPINLDAIRDKDEAYWKQFKGTPKAFISMDKAQKIWSNRFGNYTAIRISDDSFSEKEYRKLFSASVKPADLGIMVTPIRENGLNAARNGVDFSQLFLGLSFFLLLSAIILIALLFLLNLENRQSQIGTLIMLGFTRKQVSKMLLAEGALVSVFGALIGLLIAVFYTQLIFKALNTLWWAVVRTSVLEIKLNFSTLITGLLISIAVSLSAILFSVYRSFKKQTIELQRQQNKPQRGWVRSLKMVLMSVLLVISVLVVIYQLFISGSMNPALFFILGGLLLVGLLLVADLHFRRNQNKLYEGFSTADLTKRNSSRNLGRSITVVILFALGTFLVVSTGANRQNFITETNEKSSGTGGFIYFAETTVPVLYDLNDKGRREKEGIQEKFSAAQFSKIDGDDASCLNLNRTSNPAILGVNPSMMEGRFTFADQFKGLADIDPWEALNTKSSDHVIPAIADQTVIQWGLGKSVGDTLFYRNESGDTLRLKLIAGLSPSVFQGYVLISNEYFLKNYPTSSGSNIFLIDGSSDKAKAIGQELKNVFRDYGWEMNSTTERLMEFNSVENTYLSIFMALGALGLILGTVGLAIVLARSILERKNEIALLQALGFTLKQVWKLLIREYISLLVWGLLIGLLSAALAVWPNFVAPGSEVSFGYVLMIVGLILINGLIWIVLLSWLSLKPKELLSALRN
jgi:putative ABC transport system permease protein